MKIWQEELSFEYSKYLFGYCTYAIPEDESIEEMYSKGFLPASREGTKPKQFYMARSLRVCLDDFEFSSENRRVDNMYSFDREIIPVSQFDFSNSNFRKIAVDYMNNIIHIKGEEKLKQVLSADLLTHVVTYKDKEVPKGYVFLAKDGDMTHYW